VAAVTDRTDRRRLLADAGIAVIAAGGPRALTHRAVDAAAGLAAGSTSYYFRTRRALLAAVVERLAELNRLESGGDPAGLPRDVPALAEQIAVVLDGWLVDRRPQVLARYACLLEAAGDPALRDLLAIGQPFRDDAAALLAGLGSPDPVAGGRHLVAFIDGLLLDRVAGAGALTAPAAGTPESRADLAVAIEAALRGLLHEATP
jgi:AcrR family transcriptional regulator